MGLESEEKGDSLNKRTKREDSNKRTKREDSNKRTKREDLNKRMKKKASNISTSRKRCTEKRKSNSTSKTSQASHDFASNIDIQLDVSLGIYFTLFLKSYPINLHYKDINENYSHESWHIFCGSPPNLGIFDVSWQPEHSAALTQIGSSYASAAAYHSSGRLLRLELFFPWAPASQPAFTKQYWLFAASCDICGQVGPLRLDNLRLCHRWRQLINTKYPSQNTQDQQNSDRLKITHDEHQGIAKALAFWLWCRRQYLH